MSHLSGLASARVPFLPFLCTFVVGIILGALLFGSPPTSARAGGASAPKAATPTVYKKMNAGQVDNVSAAKTPAANQLLALDASAKFPDVAIPDSIQRRINGTCVAGNAIRAVDTSGNVSCEAVSGGGGWGLGGNGGTNPSTNFIGTTDNTSLALRTNNAERVRILNDGNIGIGTTNPAAKLHVANAQEGLRLQGTASGTANLAYASFYDNGGNRIGYVGDGGAGNVDTYLESDSGNVHLYTATGSALTATQNGRVGVGTESPSAKLHVSTTDTEGIYGETTFAGSGNGVHGKSNYGLASGVFGENTGGGYGVAGRANGGWAMLADGNVRQALDKGGWVKAMAYVQSGGDVIRCFNSQLAPNSVSTPPCGLTVNHEATGMYSVDFGFDVSNRFFVATPGNDVMLISYIAIDPTRVYVVSRNRNGDYTNSTFTFIMY